MSKGYGAKPETVLSWIKRGDGQGEGKDYRPFLGIRDGSRGTGTRVLGVKIDRVHRLLSRNEYRLFLLCEQSPLVADIREQFPLFPWLSTLDIAQELDIRHSVYPLVKTPIVMTSDFFITFHPSCPIRQGVLCVKQSSDVDPDVRGTRRTLEKLEVEAAYWNRRGIPWQIVTEKDIPVNRVENLDYLRPGVAAKELDWLSDHIFRFIHAFRALWTSDRTLGEILDGVSSRLSMERRHCFALFARAVWLNRLEVDLDCGIIGLQKPVRRAPKDAPDGLARIFRHDKHK
jgi:hypothetical protein